MTSLAAIQPSFLPWRGFFDMIHKVDVFIFYDDAQYSREAWRNRNKIKTAQGVQWLTVPVLTSGHSTEPIHDIRIDDRHPWRRKHLEAIRHSYRKAPYFDRYFPLLSEAYAQPWELISELDIHLTKLVAELLGIQVQWVRSSDLGFTSRRTDRLIEFCTAFAADRYLSGPTAQDYIEPEKFDKAGISLEYQVYDYPPYPQLHGDFEPFVSAIDLLFNVGDQAAMYIWGGN